MKPFYTRCMQILDDHHIPFLVGGTYALCEYTGRERPTKDFDIFVRRSDVERILAVMRQAGYRSEMRFPHWLAKIRFSPEIFMDVIFSSGNGACEVDEHWFQHAEQAVVLGHPVRLVPPEEMIWSKSFVMERERFDGADVVHLLYHLGNRLDWARLEQRFGDDWPVLFSHMMLFGYVFPAQATQLPRWLMEKFAHRTTDMYEQPGQVPDICRGTLLSRSQYLEDVDQGLTDARLRPLGRMTRRQVEIWTKDMPAAPSPSGPLSMLVSAWQDVRLAMRSLLGLARHA